MAIAGIIDELQVSNTALSGPELKTLLEQIRNGAKDVETTAAPHKSLTLAASSLASVDSLVAHLKRSVGDGVKRDPADYQCKLALNEVVRLTARLGRERDVLEAIELIRTTSFHRRVDELRCITAYSAAEAGHIALAVRLSEGLESNFKAATVAAVGTSQIERGQRQSAIRSAESAYTSLRLNDLTLLNSATDNVAYLLTRVGKHDVALALVNRFDPPNVFVTARVVEAFVDMRDLQAAESTIPLLEGRAPLGIAAMSLAKAYSDDGQFEKAVRTIDRMYEDPPHYLSHKIRALGEVAGGYKRRGKVGASNALLREAEAIANQKSNVLREVGTTSLADAYLAADELDKAKELATSLAATLGRRRGAEGFLSRPGTARVLSQLAMERQRTGKPAEAEQLLRLSEDVLSAVPEEEPLPLEGAKATTQPGTSLRRMFDTRGPRRTLQQAASVLADRHGHRNH